MYLPHITSYNRNRGSGIGALAEGISRVALPFAFKNFITSSEVIWKRKAQKSVPEVFDVITSQKSPPQAAKKLYQRQSGSRLENAS